MGLESLYLFTLLGGLAAGAYAFETLLCRKREGGRPWLIPLIVVVLFAVGLIAAATHVSSIPRAFQSLAAGTVNFGSGMIREVLVSGIFLVLAIVDLVITFAKKDSPFALRVITAIVAVVCIVLMGTAYIDVFGNTVWTNAPATVLSFLGGDLAMGLALVVALGESGYGNSLARYSSFVVNIVLAIGIALEIAAFMGAGLDVLAQAAALVVAPVVSVALVALGSKFQNARMLAIVVLVVSVVGVAISRYAFYATCTMM